MAPHSYIFELSIFAANQERTVSLQVIHSLLYAGDRPFACDECDYRSITYDNLRRHVEKQHSATTAQQGQQQQQQPLKQPDNTNRQEGGAIATVTCLQCDTSFDK